MLHGAWLFGPEESPRGGTLVTETRGFRLNSAVAPLLVPIGAGHGVLLSWPPTTILEGMQRATNATERRCRATARSGERCRARVVNAAGYCVAHDPEKPPGPAAEDGNVAVHVADPTRARRFQGYRESHTSRAVVLPAQSQA
jgi:hypothetical protein